MIVVSDSSPLILFARIGRFDLLHTVFTQIVIPDAVYAEVVSTGLDRPTSAPGALAVVAALQASWLTRHAVSNSTAATRLTADLGRGEAEAIALASEVGSRRILLDDRLGRRLARSHGLEVIGSAGVLIRAKALGAIPLVRPLLDELRLAGLYLSADVYHEACALAGE